VSGYEIHMGATTGPALSHPAVFLDDGRHDGVLSQDAQIFATYLHGLFDEREALGSLLAWAGLADPQPFDFGSLREASIERLADALEEHLDIEALLSALR